MIFLSGAFLAGLGALAIPVIIHLIHRQRYPDRAFPTLRFFDKTVKHNVLQRRLIDRILLALRVLALAALAVGLSRPFWHAPIGEPRMSLVIVLDNSPSMARIREGKPLLARAKAAIADALDKLGPADRVEILLTSRGGAAPPVSGKQLADEVALRAGHPTAMIVGGDNGAAASVPGMTTDTARLQSAAAQVPEGAPVRLAGFEGPAGGEFGYDHSRLRTLLDSVQVSAIPGDMHTALTRAGDLLARSGDGDRKVLIVSDLTAAGWKEPVNELSGLDVKVLPLEPDAPLGPNLGIDNCVISQPLASLGQLITATFTVHNYGAQASQKTTLQVSIGERNPPADTSAAGGKPVASMHVTDTIDTPVLPIPPRSSMLVTVPIRARGRDQMLCTATIASTTDPFAYDNSWNFQIGVRPPVTALCVNGSAGATGADKSTFFVMNALATRGGGSAPSADARECETDDIKNQKLFQYAVVLLADVPALDAGARQKIRQFVADGGGLLVFANPLASPDEYKAWDFLPARATAQKKKTFLYVSALAERATAVADVRRRAGSAVHALTTDNSLALEPNEGSTVLARFSDGSPALVEGRVGKGRVVFVATSCHVSKSEWPLQPAFVLLVRELMQYLGNGGNAAPVAPDRLVGEGAATAIAPEHAAGTPELFRRGPGAAVAYEALPWYRQNDRMVMPQAAEPGQYLLGVRPDTAAGLTAEPGLGADIVPISVNHDPRESDLAAASADEVRGKLTGARLAFEAPGAATITDLRSGRELWRWLVIGAVVFLLAEGLLAWKWASESS